MRKKKIAIIGNGSWSKRLQKIFSFYDFVVFNSKSQNKYFIGACDEVWFCVPSTFFINAFEKTVFSGNEKTIVSCCKGLLSNGYSPMEYLKEKLAGFDCKIKHLGGACIDDGNEIIKFGYKELETISIVKNVYAIGFAINMTKYGINKAVCELIKYQKEMMSGGLFDFEDLFATCFSNKSRNFRFGESLITGKKLYNNIII
jgi:glycerol-3-phosphate dehydrogenase